MMDESHGVLLERLYGACEQVGRWGECLQSLAAAARADGALLRVVHAPRGETVFEAVSLESNRRVAAEDLSPWFDRAASPYEVRLILVRPLQSQAARLERRALLEWLAGHLRNCATLIVESLRVSLDAAIAESVINTIDVPMFFLGPRAEYRGANASGLRMLEHGDHLALDEGRIALGDPRAQQALLGTLWEIDRLERPGLRGFPIPRAGKPPLFALLLRPRSLGAASGTAPMPQARVLIVGDPSAPCTVSVAQLGALYGLTPAESLIARAVADGQTLPEIATERRIHLSTVRTHVQRVLTKTASNRLAQVTLKLAQLSRVW